MTRNSEECFRAFSGATGAAEFLSSSEIRSIARRLRGSRRAMRISSVPRLRARWRAPRRTTGARRRDGEGRAGGQGDEELVIRNPIDRPATAWQSPGDADLVLARSPRGLRTRNPERARFPQGRASHARLGGSQGSCSATHARTAGPSAPAPGGSVPVHHPGIRSRDLRDSNPGLAADRSPVPAGPHKSRILFRNTCPHGRSLGRRDDTQFGRVLPDSVSSARGTSPSVLRRDRRRRIPVVIRNPIDRPATAWQSPQEDRAMKSHATMFSLRRTVQSEPIPGTVPNAAGGPRRGTAAPRPRCRG
jgi:hypothetical protein